MNALRHGLTARVVVLPTEDMDAWKAFSKEIVDSLDAQTPVERQFAQTVADNQWRINRIRSIEDGMLAMGHFEDAGNFDTPSPAIHSAMTAARAFRDDSKSFVNLSIYEQRLHRSMKESLRQLRELQAERRELEKKEMDDAIRLLKTPADKGLPSNRTRRVRLCERPKSAHAATRLEDALLAEKQASTSPDTPLLYHRCSCHRCLHPIRWRRRSCRRRFYPLSPKKRPPDVPLFTASCLARAPHWQCTTPTRCRG